MARLHSFDPLPSHCAGRTEHLLEESSRQAKDM
ncbi:hypothetical protein FHS92_000993 [Sphingobium subterraneum]|uniref:Uncharacterized protein n=1 Tax=Sphingobium subterraneum TaxID=627688 RepID=A0A841J183_9SPHN|nr:hypothetical protein [Sphingobium subterraneum]